MALGDYVGELGPGLFDVCEALAADDSRVYVLDSGLDAVLIFNSTTFAFITQFGSFGAGDGQFDRPTGIAIDEDFIYVVDWNNHRCSLFNKSTLVFVDKFGSAVPGDDYLPIPTAVTVDDSFIYITDRNLDIVKVFDKVSFDFESQVGSKGSGDGQFSSPTSVAVDSSFIYVSDIVHINVQVFDIDTYAFVAKFGQDGPDPGDFTSPVGVTVNTSFIFVLDSGFIEGRAPNWQTFNVGSLAFVDRFGSSGTGPDEFINPSDIAINSSNVFVTDKQNERVQVFSLVGCFSLPPGPPDSWSEILDELPDGQLVTIEFRTVDLSNGAFSSVFIELPVFLDE